MAKKTITLILTFLITSSFLCFAGGEKEPKAGEKVTVTLWHGLTAADGEYMESLMQQYIDKENPNIELQASAIAWGDLYAKMKTAYLSKTLPTFIIFHVHHVPIYAGNAINPIDDLVGPLNLKEKLIPAFYEMTKYQGKTYHIPITLVTGYTYFHKQDLIDTGFNPDFPPETISELTKFGVKATKGSGADKIWGVQIGWGYGSQWQARLHSAGGSFFNKEGTKVAFNSEAGLKALKVNLDWWYESKISPREEVGSFDDSVKRFVNHGTSCWLSGTSVIGHIEGIGRENISYQKLSYIDGGKPHVEAWYHGASLPRMGSKAADKAAMEIINWMLEPDINANFSAGSGQFPGTKAAYETELWKKEGWWLENGLPTIVKPVPFITHKKRDKSQEILNMWFNKVRDRDITPEEGLAGAEKAINQYLAE